MATVVRVLLLGLVLAGAAAAAPVPPPSPSSDALFRAHHARALDLYQARRYEEAIAALEAAYALRPDPRLQLNLGHACRRLGRAEEALVHYQRYRDQMPNLSAVELAAIEEYMSLARRAAERARQPQREAPEPAAPGDNPQEPGAAAQREAAKEPSREPPAEPARTPAEPREAPPRPTLAALRPAMAPASAPTLLVERERPRPLSPTPLYRRWWFWGAIGVVAAGAVTAAAVLSTQPWDANLPPGAPIHDPKF